jgi:lipopolysaccharide/colanic/teichoic acid biosynthesis glycosyltransferase
LYRRWGKRAFELSLGLVFALLTVPVQLALLGILMVHWRGNPLFWQQRPGYGGRLFWLVKFKTLRNGPGTDAERMTPLGNWLRKSALDELPQLWLVVWGSMACIGPRPLLKEYLPLYNARQQQRHSVRPGITGWAQVNGRNYGQWAERLEMDVWYATHISFALDLRILWRTFVWVARAEGVRAPGPATAEKFTGNL